MPSVSMTVNGKPVSGEVEGRTLLVQFLREHFGPDRHPRRLRHHPMRCLYRSCERRVREILHLPGAYGRGRGDQHG